MSFYIGQIFKDTYTPEAATWCNENGAFIQKVSSGYQIIATPGPTPSEVRTKKLAELSYKHHEAEEGGVLQSSLGFPVDVNTRANRDIAGLISQMELTSVTKTQFCDANNAFHEVTLDNLKVLQLELIQYAQSLYATKWQLRAAIEAAKSVDELNAIDIKFVTDFTPTPVVLTPDTSTSGAVIDKKTSGPAIARALEWDGDTPDALTAGALDGLAKSGYSTSDTNTATLDINPSAYQPMMAPGIYATLSDDVSVTNRFYNNPRAGKIFCDEVIFPGDPFLRLNPMTKGLTIQDVSTADDLNVTDGTPFVVVAHIAFDQIANEDFDIDVRLWSQKQGYPEEDILTDVNGRVMATTVSVKAGEKIKDIVLQGIVMAKEMQDIGIAVRHNAKNDVLQLGGRVRGGTCLVAQAITPNNHTGIALQTYERDFNKTVLFEKKYFRELAALKYWLNTPQQETTITAGEGIEESSGWGLNNITPLKVAITPERVFSLASTGTDLADYFVGWTANTLDTQALLGKSVTVSYFGSNIDSAYNVVLLKWTKKGTPAASQKMVSRNNDTIVWTDGWELADSYFIAENPSGDFQNSVTTFTVPDDAYQFAIGIVPVTAQAPSTLRLKNLFITVNKPFFTFEMLSNDTYKARITNQATFAQDRETFDVLRYTINDSFSSMPTGKLVSGTAAITVDNTKNNIPGSVIAKDGGVYVLGADMKVTINVKALLANEKNTDSIVDFSVFTFDKDGKGQEIPNCTLRFKALANTQPTLVSGTFPAFSGAKDSTFAIMMKSDKTDGAYLQTVSAQPLLSLKMVTA